MFNSLQQIIINVWKTSHMSIKCVNLIYRNTWGFFFIFLVVFSTEERIELLQEYGKILNLRKLSDGDFLSKIGKVDTGEYSITENSHKHGNYGGSLYWVQEYLIICRQVVWEGEMGRLTLLLLKWIPLQPHRTHFLHWKTFMNLHIYEKLSFEGAASLPHLFGSL